MTFVGGEKRRQETKKGVTEEPKEGRGTNAGGGTKPIGRTKRLLYNELMPKFLDCPEAQSERSQRITTEGKKRFRQAKNAGAKTRGRRSVEETVATAIIGPEELIKKKGSKKKDTSCKLGEEKINRKHLERATKKGGGREGGPERARAILRLGHRDSVHSIRRAQESRRLNQILT